LALQAQTGEFLGQILVDQGAIEQSVLTTFLVKQCRIPHLNLLDYSIDGEIVQLLPEDLCLEHSLLALDTLGNTLTIAMVNPLDMEALRKVRSHCPERRIKPILCEWTHFQQVAARVLNSKQDAIEVNRFGLPEEQKSKPEKPAEAQSGPEQAPHAAQAPASVEGQAAGTHLAAAAATAPLTEDIAEAIRHSVAEAMHEAVAQLSPPPPEPPDTDIENTLQQLGDELRETLGALKTSVDDAARRPPPFEDPRPGLEEIRKTQQALAERVSRLSEALSQAAQAAQTAIEAGWMADAPTNEQLLAAVRSASEAAGRALRVDEDGSDPKTGSGKKPASKTSKRDG
jgi:hypothetical protein